MKGIYTIAVIIGLAATFIIGCASRSPYYEPRQQARFAYFDDGKSSPVTVPYEPVRYYDPPPIATSGYYERVPHMTVKRRYARPVLYTPRDNRGYDANWTHGEAKRRYDRLHYGTAARYSGRWTY